MPVACIGHWYTSLLYLAPVVGLTAFLSAKTKLENRREAREAENGPLDATAAEVNARANAGRATPRLRDAG